MCGFAFEFALPTISLPSVTLSLPTETFGVDEERPPEGEEVLTEGVDGGLAALPPRLEKFHLPFEALSSVICGCSRVMSVTLSCLDVIRGMSSTPTFNDFAVTNGAVPNAGSSAIAILSAVTEPLRIDKLRFPTLTWRPTAPVASASILGRKLLTLITKGRATRMTMMRATTMPMILTMRFMAFFLSSDDVGGQGTTML